MMRFFAFSQNTSERRALILNAPIPRTILYLSAPSLMLGIVQSLMPLMDGLFINNIAGTLVASAVTYSEPVINMVTALAWDWGGGMAIIASSTARGFRGIQENIHPIVVAGSLLGLLSAPLLVGGCADSRFVHPDIARNVFLYLALYAFVLPFSFMESIYNGIKNANGQPEAPFLRMVLMLALKIVFNFLFIYVFRLGIVGCALSSLLANLGISAWMYQELFLKKGPDRLDLKGFRFERSILEKLWRIGVPAMLNSFMLNLGFFLINNETQAYGPVVLNGQGIANNISAVCFNLPGSFSAAVTTMVSMNIGALQADKAKRSMQIGCLISAITALATIALIVPLSSRLTLLFTRQRDVLEIANRALHIYTYSVVGFGLTMTIQGAFIGLGKTKVPLVLGILRIWLLRYLFILATERYLQYYAVFWGNLFSNYVAALLAILLISRVRWESAIDPRPRTVVAGARA